jgi:HlyD family secretion protein
MNTVKYSLLFLALTTGVSCSTIRDFLPINRTDAAIPTTRVIRKPVDVRIHTVGELHPLRSETIMAPPVSGGMLQIIYIVKTGDMVKKGDVIVRFDPSEQEYNLEQNRSQLEEAEQRIKKMRIDQAVRIAQEKVTLLNAESNVRRAELTIKENALLSRIEALKNEIALEEAERRLEQLQRDIQSNAESDSANLAAQNAGYTKAMLEMKMAQQNIDNMTIQAPMDGIVVLGQNQDALIYSSGIIDTSSIPEFKEGDQVYAGRLIAQIRDIGQMEVHSTVLETDRGNLAQGQPVDIWLNSRPTKPFTGRIRSLASTASTSSSRSTIALLASLSSRSFDITFEFDPGGEQLKLGITARIIIHGKNEENALSLPRQAIFQEEGRPVVYIKDAESWRAQDIQIKYFSESQAVVDGIDEGTEVALVNPNMDKISDTEGTNPLSSFRSGVNP